MTKLFNVGEIFRVIIFCGLSQPRKYFINKNFPNYCSCFASDIRIMSCTVAYFTDQASTEVQLRHTVLG